MSRWKVALLRPLVWLLLWTLDVVGRVPGARYARFLSLDRRAKRAFKEGRHASAALLSRELLALADGYPRDWNYGNAIHHAHITLGRVALADGDVATARAELLLAGSTPGSPQLHSFGPNMSLAQELFRAGDSEVVLEYFRLCGRFWQFGERYLAAWTAAVEQNEEPEFGPNLRY